MALDLDMVKRTLQMILPVAIGLIAGPSDRSPRSFGARVVPDGIQCPNILLFAASYCSSVSAP